MSGERPSPWPSHLMELLDARPELAGVGVSEFVAGVVSA